MSRVMVLFKLKFLDIEPLHVAQKDSIVRITGLKFNWCDHALALQNNQARLLSPIARIFANLNNAILLCTSHRSETFLGYITMDGDFRTNWWNR